MFDFQPRQAYLRVLWGPDKENMSGYINPDLLSFSYHDKDGDEADEISISLKDETGKWAGSWSPDGGMVLQAYIATGTPLVKGPELFCGTFFVDSIDFSGPPRTVSIRAVSIPLNKSIRRLVKSRAWEKQNISAIAKKIADAANLELFFDSDDDPVFDRQDQSRESDLKFLSRLCSENGLSVKVTDTQLVVFSKEKYEKKDPVATIAVGQAELLSFRFSQSHSETYRSVTVSYRNPKVKKKNSAGGEMFDKYGRPTKVAVAARSGMFDEHGRLINKKKANPAVMEYTATNPDADDSAQEYQWKKRAASVSEAKRLAEAKLRELNAKSITADISLVGNPLFCAGEVVRLTGFGSFDGNFYIDDVTHSLGSGYTTSLNLHRVKT